MAASELPEKTQAEATGIKGGGGTEDWAFKGWRGSEETFFLELQESQAFCKAARMSVARESLKRQEGPGMSQRCG